MLQVSKDLILRLKKIDCWNGKNHIEEGIFFVYMWNDHPYT